MTSMRVMLGEQPPASAHRWTPHRWTPQFVKRSINDGEKVKIAAIDPDFD